ncbi:MAG TPA: hypothetical protein VLM42_12005 [Bryobacteraceae bacterium]|nr:hypothetical protein [Bryobacteraceae bacterium]
MKSIVVLVVLGAAALAQTPEATYLEARTALQKKDFEGAVKILRPLAEGGLARAQSTLGGMYASGLGVPQSYTEAVAWFQNRRRRDSRKARPIWASRWATDKALRRMRSRR